MAWTDRGDQVRQFVGDGTAAAVSNPDGVISWIGDAADLAELTWWGAQGTNARGVDDLSRPADAPGSEPFPLVIDASTLSPSDGFVIAGDSAGDLMGVTVSHAGDVNGDGIDDIIVGAPRGDDGGNNAGEAYIIFGTASGFGTTIAGRQVIDVTSLTATQGFIIQGAAAGETLGQSVSAAGDVNGDGIGDLIVGSNSTSTSAGRAYVVFGTNTGFGSAVTSTEGFTRQVIDVSTLSGADGFIIRGDQVGDGAADSVSAAGDVNGDGIDDLIIGAPDGDDGGNSSGQSYVVFGSTGGFGTPVGGQMVVDLATLSAAQGFVVIGDAAYHSAGIVSSAGDVNSDGIDDLIIGAPWAGGHGAAYLVFGSTAGFGTSIGGRQVIDLTTLSAAQGFVINGDANNIGIGISVSAAGDINGDGIDDVAVGGAGDDTEDGAVYVIFGTADGFGTALDGRQVVALSSLSAAQGFVVKGQTQDFLGTDVAPAGDVNGDGIDDLVIGGPRDDGGGVLVAEFGRAYVLYGTRDGFGPPIGGRQILDLASFTSAQGFTIQGAQSSVAGFGASGAGDLNGDGIDDLIVGAPFARSGDASGGEAYVIFGRAVEAAEPINGTANGDTLDGTSGDDQINGLAGNDTLNGLGGNDTIDGGEGDDMLNGGPGADTLVGGTGEDRFVYGAQGESTETSTDRISDFVSGADRIDLRAAGATSVAWQQVSDGTGTYNVVTAQTPTGEMFIRVDGAVARADFVLAAARQSGPIDLLTLAGADGFVIRGDQRSSLGYATASAGDVNGDGIDDIVVGAYGTSPDATDLNTDGAAYVLFGKTGGFGTPDGTGTRVVDLLALAPADGFMIAGSNLESLGVSLAAAGDVNNDGYDDIIVGAQDSSFRDAVGPGRAYVIFGGAGTFGAPDGNGRDVLSTSTFSAANGFVINGIALEDFAGSFVAGAGDINGDGFADVMVGAVLANGGVGEAYVVFGKAGGFSNVDAATMLAGTGCTIVADQNSDGQLGIVSLIGDINGDGFADIGVGAPDNDGGDGGIAYILFGGAGGFGTDDGTGRARLDLTNLSPAVGFKITAAVGFDFVGCSIAAAGDVNNDGFDDYLVGAESHGTSRGATYLLFGKASGFGPIHLGALAAADGVRFLGEEIGDRSGGSVSSAGDFNGDGYDDILIGAIGVGDPSNGAAYVVFGRPGPLGESDGNGGRTFDLSRLNPNDAEYDPSLGIKLFYANSQDDLGNLGRSVSAAGDINNDGYDDIIVGNDGFDDGTGDSFDGRAYVIFGAGSDDAAGPINGTPGDDVLNGTAGDDEINGLAGNDTLNGLGGNDTLNGGDGSDTLDGGAGSDQMDGGDGDDTLLTRDGSEIAHGGAGADTLTVDYASATSDMVTTGISDSTGGGFSGGYVVNSTQQVSFSGIERFVITSGSGNDVMTTGSGDDVVSTGIGADLLLMHRGGNDNVSGGAGDDGFYFGAAYTAADTLDGGAGTLDQLGLQGDYSAGVTLGAMTGVEMIVLLPGDDARFGGATGTNLSYNITAPNVAVAAGQILTIQANMLRLGENFTFNGSAETDGSFLTFGGLGTDTITGGAGDDGFYFGDNRFFSSVDVVNGGGGSDQLGLQGDFTGGNALSFGASQMSSIETLVMLSASDERFGGFRGPVGYDLTMHDGNVAAGQRMVVSANSLLGNEALTFDGAAEADGSFQIFSGAGDDRLTGSQRDDDIWGGAGSDVISGAGGADALRGGAGADSFGYGQAADSTDAARDQILDFASGDSIDLSVLAANSGGGDFTFIGSSGQSGARQVQVLQNGNAATVSVFIDADAIADLVIDVTVADGHTLTAGDFDGVLSNAEAWGTAAGKAGTGELDLTPARLAHGHDVDGAATGALSFFDPVSLPDLFEIDPLRDHMAFVATGDLIV